MSMQSQAFFHFRRWNILKRQGIIEFWRKPVLIHRKKKKDGVHIFSSCICPVNILTSYEYSVQCTRLENPRRCIRRVCSKFEAAISFGAFRIMQCFLEIAKKKNLGKSQPKLQIRRAFLTDTFSRKNLILPNKDVVYSFREVFKSSRY